jgi:hypothetical protein
MPVREDDDPLSIMLDETAARQRLERVARAKCRAAGINPDHVFDSYAGPVWRSHLADAQTFLAMLDAASDG